MDEVERVLLLHASTGVLKSYLSVRCLAHPLDPAEPVTRSAIQRLIFEMRRDLGHRDLPWSSAHAVDLVLRQEESPGESVSGSGQFKVVQGSNS